MYQFEFTAPVLIVLLLSYLKRPQGQRMGSSLVLWLVTYQMYFIALIGVGLIQTHIGCQSLLGDCYVENYPTALWAYKYCAFIYIVLWISAATMKVIHNIFFCRREPI